VKAHELHFNYVGQTNGAKDRCGLFATDSVHELHRTPVRDERIE